MMDLRKESYLMEYRQRELHAGLERKRQIREALTLNTSHDNHILARFGHILRALGNARRIRIEISFDYNEPRPKATGC